MSARTAARNALANWLVNADIEGLDRVWTAYPMRLDFNSYGAGPYRCQAVIWIDEEGELRFALGGQSSGKKRIDYLIGLELYHRSTAADPEAAQADFDRLVDDVKARLRADRRLGATEDIVWQAGEGAYGIQCDFAVPADNSVGGEPLENYARLRFEITQWISA